MSAHILLILNKIRFIFAKKGYFEEILRNILLFAQYYTFS